MSKLRVPQPTYSLANAVRKHMENQLLGHTIVWPTHEVTHGRQFFDEHQSGLMARMIIMHERFGHKTMTAAFVVSWPHVAAVSHDPKAREQVLVQIEQFARQIRESKPPAEDAPPVGEPPAPPSAEEQDAVKQAYEQAAAEAPKGPRLVTVP